MNINLIPCGYSKSGDSIKFTTNGFKYYYIKKDLINIEIYISEYEDWNNIYVFDIDDQYIEQYGKSYFRIHQVNSIFKK